MMANFNILVWLEDHLVNQVLGEKKIQLDLHI